MKYNHEKNELFYKEEERYYQIRALYLFNIDGIYFYQFPYI